MKISKNVFSPTRYSKPLSKNFQSLYDKYAVLVSALWIAAFGHDLDFWQKELIRRILELRPDGKLRYRRVLVSLARQNGKSEFVAALGVVSMLARKNWNILGIASSAAQANLVYRRALAAVSHKDLQSLFSKTTETQGITARNGSRWIIRGSTSGGLQGYPVDTGIVDEVHLLHSQLWYDMINGMGGRENVQVIGITTAGDDDSELLKDLYLQTNDAATDYGFFIWEAPEARVPESDDLLGRFLIAANPAIACGRIPLDNAIADVRSQPASSVIRYRLNRFTDGRSATFIPIQDWNACEGDLGTISSNKIVFAIDRTPTWSTASVTAAWEDGDKIKTQVVAVIPKPSIESLVDECVKLKKKAIRFVGDGYSMKPVLTALEEKKLPVSRATLGDVSNAAGRLYARVQEGSIVHPGDERVVAQLRGTILKPTPSGGKPIPAVKGLDIDLVVGTTLASFYAEQFCKKSRIQVF